MKKTTLRIACLIGVLIAAYDVGAAAAQARTGPARAREPQRIDPLTGSIRGRVTVADSGAPVQRAEVRAISEGGVRRIATTDGDGRFEFRDLPAGSFRVSAAKSGLVTLHYGQRRPFEAATPIQLKEGQQATADIALLRGGVISGYVYDRFGEPLSGVRVNAMRGRVLEGRRRMEAIAPGDETDDRGAFRLFGLTPGEYYVAARRPREGQSGNPASAVPIYYPGTLDIADAQRIIVEPMSEASAVFQLVPAASATVSGIVLDAAGLPPGEALISMVAESVVMGYTNAAAGVMPLTLSGHTKADGSFEVTGVPPGSYTLRATTMPNMARAVRVINETPGEPLHEEASTSLVVGGQNVSGLTLTTSKGASINGSFVRDPAATAPLPQGLGVSVTSLGSSGTMRNVRPDNTFRLTGLLGRLWIQGNDLPDPWIVKAVIVDGDDVTDTPVDLKNRQDVPVRIVVTDRATEVSGVVTPRAAREHDVVVFSDDSTKWTYPSRHIQATRTDNQGRFRIKGLPAGERYLAVAVDYLEDGEAQDPGFLEGIRARATSFSLGDAERKTVDLRPVRR